jgi:hypothetical protein
MATTVTLERLVHAIVTSVIQAQHLVETAQLSNLRAYFDSNDKPITMDIKLPTLDGKSEDFDIYQVPVVSLVSHGSLVINEANLKMDVELGGVQQDYREPGTYPTVAELARGQDRPVMPKLLVDPESGGISKKKGGSVAQVSLKLVSAETTEGLASVLNEAIKGQGRLPKA